jgi:hypothetical protein
VSPSEAEEHEKFVQEAAQDIRRIGKFAGEAAENGASFVAFSELRKVADIVRDITDVKTLQDIILDLSYAD